MSEATSMTGHLFVVHGRIETIGSDAIVVPTDDDFNVEPHWYALFAGKQPSRPDTWEGAFARSEGDDSVWFVNIVDSSVGVSVQLADRLRSLLTEVAQNVQRADRRPPVVAMPVFGLAGGGKDRLKGAVIRDLVTLLWDIVGDLTVDITLVTPDRSVFSAIQHFRRTGRAENWQLNQVESGIAQDLGSKARDGDLALFLGAGVSMSAGLPSWGELLAELGARAGIDNDALRSLDESPLDKAELISIRLGEKLGKEVSRIVGRAKQVSLAHSLLAGLGCREVVTTNYDQLYEDAIQATGHPRPTVIPWESVKPGRPWVLKMHGEVNRPDTVVLTRRSFVRYDAKFRPAGSLLQALMMTRHVLVVGTSMTDDNVIRLALEVDDFISRDHSFGTFVDVSEPSARAELWNARFRWLHCGGEDTSARVRTMEIFLDAVVMYATHDASWLLDERFSGLLQSSDQRAATEVRGVLGRVQATPRTRLRPLRNQLADLGAVPHWSESRSLLSELELLLRASKDGRRATYKYVVLLWAVTRAQQGHERLTRYKDSRKELASLLSPFRIADTAPKPLDPWYALRTSSWWEVRDLPANPTAQDVVRLDARAGLARNAYDLVHRDSVFAQEAAEKLVQLIERDADSASAVRDLLKALDGEH